ncbi:hypothetical protein PsorP6_000829 [Peronosclerospora sorghi]|uniref:Uncharacterized protein n=1 Tax=Peronosclerospora sorghi TaxID=230839 RepID=A0ACC0WRJ1_9STRA|nr:hypothetical protein PsorP6_000829 [Peronosclerospora sorghi]
MSHLWGYTLVVFYALANCRYRMPSRLGRRARFRRVTTTTTCGLGAIVKPMRTLAIVFVVVTMLMVPMDARPMHGAIVSKYHRYLEERDQICAELDDWLAVYGPTGTKSGFMPVIEARSEDEAREDMLQRFYLTKEDIHEAREANPMAEVGTQGPFTLMTMAEFQKFIANSRLKPHNTSSNSTRATPRVKKPHLPHTSSSSTPQGESSDTSDDDCDDGNSAADSPIAITEMRRLGTAATRPHGFNRATDVKRRLESTLDTSYAEKTDQSPTVQSTDEANTAWTFRDVVPRDSSHVAAVSGEGGSRTNWQGKNDWGLNGLAPAVPAPVAASVPAASPASTALSPSARAADSVDWSKSACVNPPDMQGQCSSCWSFVTASALEAVQCIHSGDKQAPKYSKQQLVSCTSKNFGCHGGAPEYAIEYIRDHGICTESSYPYTSMDGGHAAACSTTCTPVTTGIPNVAKIEPGDERTLLNVVQQQPVIASVVSNTAVWKQYISGVITSCPTAAVDHAVLVVGYDATTIKIQNSWGTDWGDDGYVRISRSAETMGTCAVLSDLTYPEL